MSGFLNTTLIFPVSFHFPSNTIPNNTLNDSLPLKLKKQLPDCCQCLTDFLSPCNRLLWKMESKLLKQNQPEVCSFLLTQNETQIYILLKYFSVRSVLLCKENKAVQQELQDESSFFGLCSGSGKEEKDSVDNNRKMNQLVPTCYFIQDQSAFTAGTGKHWHRMLRGVMGSPSCRHSRLSWTQP